MVVGEGGVVWRWCWAGQQAVRVGMGWGSAFGARAQRVQPRQMIPTSSLFPPSSFSICPTRYEVKPRRNDVV